MRPLTDHCPKPLLPFDQDHLIGHHIRRCVQSGYTQIVINIAYHKRLIKKKLGDGRLWGASIQYSEENIPLETAGGICQALKWLGDQPFLLISADVFIELDYAQLKLPPGRLAHLILVDNPEHHPEGDFCLQPDGSLGLDGAKKLTYSGVSLLDPRLLQGCRIEPAKLGPVLKKAASQGQISGEYYSGFWLDVGTPERYQQLKQYYGSRNRTV